jgi:hypothetical protein
MREPSSNYSGATIGCSRSSFYVSIRSCLACRAALSPTHDCPVKTDLSRSSSEFDRVRQESRLIAFPRWMSELGYDGLKISHGSEESLWPVVTGQVGMARR